MSDSLSSADRDARIAAIENFHALVLRGGGGYNSDIIRAQTAHITTLLAELRAALSREEEAKQQSIVGMGAMQAMLQEMRLASGEAKKDAERLARGLNDALRLIDAASPFAWHNGNTHNGIDEGEVLTGRFLESIRASALSHSRRTAECKRPAAP